MTIDDMIAVLQAAKEGKSIQWLVNDKWEDLGDPPWNIFKFGSYRVKPEPKVIWVNEYAAPEMVCAHNTKEEATRDASSGASRVAVKYVEAAE